MVTNHLRKFCAMQRFCYASILFYICSLTACSSSENVPRGPQSQARHDAFIQMMPHYTNMVQMANGTKNYDKKTFIALVETFQSASHTPFEYFASSENQTNGRTKEAVWSNPQEFKQRQNEFFASVKLLQDSAQHHSLSQIKTSLQLVEQQCMACHAQFRK